MTGAIEYYCFRMERLKFLLEVLPKIGVMDFSEIISHHCTHHKFRVHKMLSRCSSGTP